MTKNYVVNEELLQFIWRFQYYNKSQLTTEQGEKISIVRPGNLNTNQGPDFIDAAIKIGTTTWVGSLEVHIKTSDWDAHQHSQDRNYKNVILHVVYENDKLPIESCIPLLVLKHRIAHSLLNRYSEMMRAQYFIPCEKNIHQVPLLTIKMWKETLAVSRLQQKTGRVSGFLKETNHHWEESFWWLIARNFGIRVNSDAFEAMARSLPLNLLAKHRHNLIQLEAFLLGQAGLLNETFDLPYPQMLKKEYKFLKSKYFLKEIGLPVHFLRMRPGNFPTIRLAQLAALIHNSNHLFSKILEEPSQKKLGAFFTAVPNDFWHYHYTLSDEPVYREKPIGASMIDNIIINTVVPSVFLYAGFHQNEQLKDKALNWLEQVRAENNSITRGFMKLGIENKNAFDSQSLIGLKTNYCDLKKCLDCAIGNSILKESGIFS